MFYFTAYYYLLTYFRPFCDLHQAVIREYNHYKTNKCTGSVIKTPFVTLNILVATCGHKMSNCVTV